MDEKEIKKLADDLSSQIDEKFKALEEQNKLSGGANEGTMTEVKNMVQEHAELIEKKDKANEERFKKQQEHLDALDIKAQQQKDATGPEFSFKQNIKSFVKKNYDKWKYSNNPGKTPVELKFEYADMDTKAVADMTTATHFTGEVTPPTRVPGVFYDPANPVRIRSLITQGGTNSNLIRFIRETGGEGTATVVAEAGTKPQKDFDIATVDRSVRKIASYIRVPEEMMDDNAFVQSYLATRGIDNLKDVEDTQILTGDNTGQNLDGILNNAVVYADANFTLASATALDVLYFAGVQVAANFHYMPTAILLHPREIGRLAILKDSQNRHLNESIYTGQYPNIGGIPLIANTAIAQDAFIVGDFIRGTQIWDRMQANVRFYDQDQDNAIKNMITIVIEERLCQTVYRPNAFVYSTGLAAAVTAAQS